MEVDNPELVKIVQLELENEELKKKIVQLTATAEADNDDEMIDTPHNELERNLRTNIDLEYQERINNLNQLLNEQGRKLQEYEKAQGDLTAAKSKALGLELDLLERQQKLQTWENSLKKGTSKDLASLPLPNVAREAAAGSSSGSGDTDGELKKLRNDLRGSKALNSRLKKEAKVDKEAIDRMDKLLSNRDPKAAAEFRDAEKVRRELGNEIDDLKERLAAAEQELAASTDSSKPTVAGPSSSGVPIPTPAPIPAPPVAPAPTPGPVGVPAPVAIPAPTPVVPGPAASAEAAAPSTDESLDNTPVGSKRGFKHTANEDEAYAKKLKTSRTSTPRRPPTPLDHPATAGPTEAVAETTHTEPLDQDEQAARDLFQHELDVRNARDGKKKEEKGEDQEEMQDEQ